MSDRLTQDPGSVADPAASRAAGVVALAGRRVDPPDASTARFPLASVPAVRTRLSAFFLDRQPLTLVCSAACGADLVALDTAMALGLRCRVVLPFEARRFRASSVVDRPGDWGPVFDRVIEAAAATGDLVVLDTDTDGEEAYAAATQAILDEAQRLAQGVTAEPPDPGAVVAVVVWEGRTRGDDDQTALFAAAAQQRGWPVIVISSV